VLRACGCCKRERSDTKAFATALSMLWELERISGLELDPADADEEIATVNNTLRRRFGGEVHICQACLANVASALLAGEGLMVQ